jgi:hypothetical protein
MGRCEKTTKDGQVRCRGSKGHDGPCFLGGVTLADFDRVAEAKLEETDGRRAIEALRTLVQVWGDGPIYVTGDGATPFLDALHACECVVDSLPPVSAKDNGSQPKGRR